VYANSTSRQQASALSYARDVSRSPALVAFSTRRGIRPWQADRKRRREREREREREPSALSRTRPASLIFGAFPRESIAAPQVHQAKPVHLVARSSADREYRRCRCAGIFLRIKQEEREREREREREGEKGNLSVPRYCDRVAAACAWSARVGASRVFVTYDQTFAFNWLTL